MSRHESVVPPVAAVAHEEQIRGLVARLGRPHSSGGTVIERAALMAEGADFDATVAWILAHGGKQRPPVAAPPARAARVRFGRLGRRRVGYHRAALRIARRGARAITRARRAPRAATGMRAVVQDEYGPSPEAVLRLADVPRPEAGDNDLLVRVCAASVDRGTWHAMAGLPYPIRLAGFGVRRPKGLNPGRNVAGIIESAGANVTGFAPGDEVYGTCDGAFAEYAIARAGRLASKPAHLSFEHAAAIPVSGLTALQAVRDKAQVRAGQKVLVTGASGGVGTFAVQIAKAVGAEVTGVCSTAKVDLVRSLGADRVLDYTREEIADGGRRYDAILDIGGNRPLSQLCGALASAGRLVIVGGETDGRLLGGSDRQLRALVLSRFVKPTLTTFVCSENAADLTALRHLVESGAVAPAIDRTFPLDEVPAAVRYLLEGRARGKVVIAV